MAEAGKRLAAALDTLMPHVAAGVTTREIDREAYLLIEKAGCTPAFLGYAPAGARVPYPATICASVNDTVVHGLPNADPLKEGDVVSIDIGLVYKGWYADMARTVVIGEADERVRDLVATTRLSLEHGIVAAQPGNTVGDIGHAIQTYVEERGFSIVKGLTGHGIGRKLHEDPYIFNAGRPGDGERLIPGMVIAIEPMVALGKGASRQRRDDSFATKDGSIAAHFEHTVAITDHGPRVLTRV